ncbi:EF-P beta-lysylation protein EpmB [Halopseudomonas sp. Lyrl_26]|uniref:EF-P beta-lysylation protein EpmB n=1 Tax=Halopseudomonas sp. Lyrl_26 TaxID=3110923 RepID=UPI003F7E2FCC
MIHGSLAPVESVSWQSLLSRSITDPEQLLRRLELDPALLAGARAGAADFPLRVPEPFVERMHKSDPNDPLLRQVLPLGEELLEHPDYVLDPLGEQHTNTRAGIIHKYHGRLLLIVSGGCAVNCRYCFRRHFPYGDNNLSTEQWQQALDYIRGDQSISEVIYSGGDPLAASDKRLAWLTREIAAIPHVRRLRVHTRLPVVIPQRVTSELIDALCGTRLPVVMVLHSNHANEFDAALGNAVLRLRQAGITLLNQTVLLRGVNDSLETLISLSETLGDHGILPYYLHVLDHVKGAQHFHVDDGAAMGLAAEMLARLPGFLVPRLVREVAGETSKTPLPFQTAGTHRLA